MPWSVPLLRRLENTTALGRGAREDPHAPRPPFPSSHWVVVVVVTHVNLGGWQAVCWTRGGVMPCSTCKAKIKEGNGRGEDALLPWCRAFALLRKSQRVITPCLPAVSTPCVRHKGPFDNLLLQIYYALPPAARPALPHTRQPQPCGRMGLQVHIGVLGANFMAA